MQAACLCVRAKRPPALLGCPPTGDSPANERRNRTLTLPALWIGPEQVALRTSLYCAPFHPICTGLGCATSAPGLGLVFGPQAVPTAGAPRIRTAGDAMYAQFALAQSASSPNPTGVVAPCTHARACARAHTRTHTHARTHTHTHARTHTHTQTVPLLRFTRRRCTGRTEHQ